MNSKRVQRSLIGLSILIASTAMADAQSAHRHKRTGDLMYDQQEYAEAEEAYRKANAAKATPEGIYNLGNAIYQQQRYEEAVRQYEAAIAQASDDELKARSFYNLGNTHLQAQQLEEGIEAYKNALKLMPQDLDAKKNLTLALQQLQQQQQQQQQEQQQEQQQQQDEEQQDDQQQEQQQQEQQPQQQPDEDQQQQQEPSRDLSKEEAEELLRIIEAEDQRVQEKLRKGSADPKKPKKDW
ncbi:MAG: tetratricopeptide repeat protein [Saprospiraceae bacterium]|nr:tetratricopeptide repeat protein [Saprospiraceae bacterium]